MSAEERSIQRLRDEIDRLRDLIGGRSEDELAQLDDRLSSEIDRSRQLQQDIGKLRKENQKLQGDLKEERSAQQSTQSLRQSSRSEVESLQEVALEERNKNRDVLQRSVEVEQSYQDQQKAFLRVLEENRQLRDENQLLAHETASKEDDLDQALKTLDEVIAERDQLQGETSALNGQLLNEKSGANSIRLEMIQVRKLLTDANEKEKLLHDKIQQMDRLMIDQGRQHEDEVARLAAELTALQHTPDTTPHDSNELSMTRKALEESNNLIMQLEGQLSKSVSLKMHSSLIKQDDSIQPTQPTNDLLLIKQLRESMSDQDVKLALLTTEKDKLQKDLDESELEKASLASDDAMKAMMRLQKKQKRDLDRQQDECSQLAQRLGDAVSAREMMYEMCQRLKVLANLPPDFGYDESELRSASISDRSRLEGLVKEYERQLNDSEAERVRLLRTLRDNAMQISEKGIKFHGLGPNHLVLVNEFARNLRDGKVELPVDSRTHELQQETIRLKGIIDIDRIRIDQLESELSSSSSHINSNKAVNRYGDSTIHSESPQLIDDVSDLKKEMKSMIGENKRLRDTIATHQTQVMDVIKTRLTHDHASLAPSKSSDALMVRLLEQSGEILDSVQSSSLVASGNIVKLSQEVKQLHSARQSTDVSSQAKPLVASKPPLIPIYVTPRDNEAMQSFFQSQPLPLQTPATPHGKILLSRQLSSMCLPPEDWAEEVKEMSGQLMECLETLLDNDQGRDKADEEIRQYHVSITGIRQQVAILYEDFVSRMIKTSKRDKLMAHELNSAKQQRDSYQARFEKSQELLQLLQSSLPQDVQHKITDCMKRIAIFEINESILCRRFLSLEDSLKHEHIARNQLEADYYEMETSLKQRILELEQYKLWSSSKLELISERLNRSVSRCDYETACQELDSLRDNFINMLQREVELRCERQDVLDQTKKQIELSRQGLIIKVENEKLKKQVLVLQSEIGHQTRLVSQLSDGSEGPSSNVAEMSVYRSTISRLEIDLAANSKRCELLQVRVVDLETIIATEVNKTQLLDCRLRDSLKSEADMRLECSGLMGKLEGCITADEAESLRQKHENAVQEAVELNLNVDRYKELAEIASSQTKSIANIRKNREESMLHMQGMQAVAESKSDDSLTIGTLQRQIISIKKSFRNYAAKCKSSDSVLRQREIMIKKLEHQLDNRQESLLELQDRRREEVDALKGALRDIVKMNMMDEASTPSTNKLSELDVEMKKLAMRTDAQEERTRVAESIRDRLEHDLSSAQMECEQFRLLVEDLKQAVVGPSNQPAVANRLVLLSDSVRSSKLACIDLTRQVQQLKEEKRSQEIRLLTQQDAIKIMERKHVDLETRALFREEDNLMFPPVLATGPLQTIKQADDDDRLQSLLKESKKKCDDLDKELKSLRFTCEEQDRKIRYYERVTDASGSLSPSKNQPSLDVSSKRQVDEEHDRLQAAANATIGSLRALLDQKNVIIDRLEARLSELRETAVAAETDQDRKLQRLLAFDEASRPASKLLPSASRLVSEDDKDYSNAQANIMDKILCLREEEHLKQVERLVSQMEQINASLIDKDDLIRQLELKLRTVNNQRERAEARCGETIEEMEKQKADLILIANHLQQAETKMQDFEDGSSQEKKLHSLNRIIKSQTDTIKGLQEALVGIKDNFIKAEEKHAIDIVRMSQSFNPSSMVAQPKDVDESKITDEKEMKPVVDVVRSDQNVPKALVQLREALKKAQRQRDEVSRSKEEMTKKYFELDKDCERLRLRATTAEGSVINLRKDLEDTKLRIARHAVVPNVDHPVSAVEEKTGDDASVLTAGPNRDMTVLKKNLSDLEKRLALVKAENTALRHGDESPRLADAAAQSFLAPPSISHRIVESDDKLRKRVVTLTDRLTAKTSELEKSAKSLLDLRSELDLVCRQRDTLQERLSKLQKESQDSRSFRPLDGDVSHLSRRLVEVEDENLRLRHRIDVELACQISQLKLQADQAEGEAKDERTENRRAEELYREARSALTNSSSSGMRSLEDHFLMVEDLKEQLFEARQKKRQLESALLERDSSILEFQFDVEAKKSHLERLSKRIQELELISSQQVLPDIADADQSVRVRATGSRKKKVEETNNLVDAMKKAIDRLKLDNDRLRQGVSENVRVSEAERRFKEANKRLTLLEQENETLKAQVNSQRDLSLKLTQKQNQLSMFRKAAKSNEDDVVRSRREFETLQSENTDLTKHVAELRVQIQELERQIRESGRNTESRYHADDNDYAADKYQEKISLAEREIDRLRSELRKTQKNDAFQQQSDLQGRISSLLTDNQILEEENRKLRNELGSFDMEFFEEIEDLKYRCANAESKLLQEQGLK